MVAGMGGCSMRRPSLTAVAMQTFFQKSEKLSHMVLPGTVETSFFWRPMR